MRPTPIGREALFDAINDLCFPSHSYESSQIINAVKELILTFPELDSSSQWIDVRYDLPVQGRVCPCLVYVDGERRAADWSCDRFGMNWWFYVDGEYEPTVTHWMEWPDEPVAERSNK